MSPSDTQHSDVYDPDGVLPQNSPRLKPRVVNLKPTPSPPLPQLPSLKQLGPFPGLGSPDSKLHNTPDPGYAVLIRALAGGRLPDGTHEELSRPLPGLHDKKVDSSGEESDSGDSRADDEGLRSSDMSPLASPGLARPLVLHGPNKMANNTPTLDLKSLATNAMKYTNASPSSPVDTQGPGTFRQRESSSRKLQSPVPLPIAIPNAAQSDHCRRDSQRSASTTSMSPYSLPGFAELHGSSPGSLSLAAKHLAEGKFSAEPLSTGLGGLPPIQMASPPSDTNSLPSIRSQFREQLTNGPGGPDRRPSDPRSPSGIGLGARLNSIQSSHGSPPVTPDEVFRAGIPSPASSAPARSPFPFSPPALSMNHGITGGYAASHSGEVRHFDRSPPAQPVIDRMSIDSMTNPPSGFVCSFSGCTAAPFQTQYLLNSHANVHSSARPHYCPVKGCPRAEGGKGFKRKNEMIRHGLVHESPGYVCPFCPDREHKYPRPDNLQRHVRVHHVDKDKDDALLRDVLAQRPDGPNRGRRRRGGP